MFLHQNPLEMLKHNSKQIIVAGFVAAVIFVIVSLFFPLEYRADADVLVVSKSRYGVDPYTVVKSAERIGENLIQVIGTSDFYDKVMSQPGYTLDKSRFEGQNITERTKRKRWQKAVTASVVYGTGMVRVSAYNKDPHNAEQLAGAVMNALVGQGWQYVGGDVTIKVVDSPITTRFPARPNLLLNALAGFLAGVLGAGLLVVRKR